MGKNFLTLYGKIIALLVIVAIAMGCSASAAPVSETENPQPVPEEQTIEESAPAPAQKFKILHIMSYHSPWEWTDSQFDGFKSALKGLDVEYKVIQMDTKHNNTDEWKKQVAQEAKALIDTWQPDLVYTSDDDVQPYIVKDYINTDIPFVFSAVNTDPAEYGFVGSKNITGVVEHQHYVESVQLLKQIVPGVKKIAVVVDESPFWKGVTDTMREEQSLLPDDVEIVSWDLILTFEEYKQKMAGYQTTVDAVALLGVFNFKDENGANVPFEKVLQWTVENSNLPDFSFWSDRITHGTLCSVTVSGYEQGRGAGEIARAILVEGKSPSSFPMEPTVKGEPVVNLARANKLGLKIDSDILLTADVINTFSWEEK